jgi:hypothetical protein
MAERWGRVRMIIIPKHPPDNDSHSHLAEHKKARQECRAGMQLCQAYAGFILLLKSGLTFFSKARKSAASSSCLGWPTLCQPLSIPL